MEENQDTDQQTQDPQQGTSPQTPSYVTADEFRSMQTTVQQAFEGINASLQALAAARNMPLGTGKTETPEPTLDDIASEFEQGNVKAGLSKVMGVIKSDRERTAQILRAKDEENARSLAAMAKEMTFSARDAKGALKFPHYDRYKKEIDALLAQSPVEALRDPKAFEWTYNLVVGQHLNELINEAQQAATRSPRETSNVATPGQINRAEAPGAGSIEGLSQQEIDILASMGRTPESYAKSLGYANVQDWLKARKGEEVGK